MSAYLPRSVLSDTGLRRCVAVVVAPRPRSFLPISALFFERRAVQIVALTIGAADVLWEAECVPGSLAKRILHVSHVHL